MIRTAAPVLALLALAACDRAAPVAAPAGDDSRRATGAVLGGEISDAMIPLDELTSSPPAARPTAAASAAGGEPAARPPARAADPASPPPAEGPDAPETPSAAADAD